MVFATDRGVISGSSCASFTTVLTASEKLKSLELATCQASMDEDRIRILRFVARVFGQSSAQEQIKELMGHTMSMSMKQLKKVTAGLLCKLGHGHTQVTS